MKVKTTTKDISKVEKKYTRLVLTENKKDKKLVETKSGQTELHLGVGKFKDITPRQFIKLVRAVVQIAKSLQVNNLAVQFSDSPFSQLKKYGDEWVVKTIAENLILADYEFNRYKSKKVTEMLKEVVVCGAWSKSESTAFKTGLIVGEYVNKARDIANTPGDDMTPSQLAKEAQKLARGSKVKVRVLDEKGIKKEGLHALWAVGKGADDLPRFIVMEYWGTKRSEKPIVLVGKGITYDTGGLNVKPSGAMHDMHMDMSGGSAVIAAIGCAAKLGIKKNVVAIVPAAENSVSAKSMRAGDIINSHAGKTIEVLHTDAEGRLVLADGLSYAAKYKPKVVLDAATLTGASLVALGKQASAIMTTDKKLETKLVQLGEESGDLVWPLPLWDEYKEPLTQTRADVVNIQPGFSKLAGTIEGAAFLSFFAPKCPWAHIDIAPRMDSIPNDKLAKGSTGEPVRLLVRFIEQYQ